MGWRCRWSTTWRLCRWICGRGSADTIGCIPICSGFDGRTRRPALLMLRDLRYAARLLLRSKGWTAMVVLSLALGIGANTALFSAVNGLALRTLPVDDPGSLVRFRHVG